MYRKFAVCSIWLDIQDDTSSKKWIDSRFCLFASIWSRKSSKYSIFVWHHVAKSSYLVNKINCYFARFIKWIICLFNRNSVFANELAALGHNLTVISVDRDDAPPNGVHYIYMEGLYMYNEIYDKIVKNAFVPHETSPFGAITEYTDYMANICKGDRIIALIVNIWNGCEKSLRN